MKTLTCNCMEGYDCPVCFDRPETMKENMTTQTKPVPHIHAEVIKAWADGHVIEFRRTVFCEWERLSTKSPAWHNDCQYRVKPTPKPDILFYANCLYNVKDDYLMTYVSDESIANLKLTFDGDTGKLKKAEVL